MELRRAITEAYTRQDVASLEHLPLDGQVKSYFALQWRGDLKGALREYPNLDAGQPPFIAELLAADRRLLEAKCGESPTSGDGAGGRGLIGFVRAYADCTHDFWTFRRRAWRSLVRMLGHAIYMRSGGAVVMTLFLLAHLATLSGSHRLGFALARLFYGVARRAREERFFRNIVLAAYPYTMVASGRPDCETQRALENGERYLTPDPSDRGIFYIGILYRAAEAGDIARTEVYAHKLMLQSESGNLPRYRTFVELITLLPLALRGYTHIVEKRLERLSESYEACDDPIVKCEYALLEAIINACQGKHENAQRLREECQRLAKEAQAPAEARRHDRLLAKCLELQATSNVNSHVGSLLTQLIELSGASHASLDAYAAAVAARIAEHLDSSSYTVDVEPPAGCGVRVSLIFLDRYVVFHDIPSERCFFAQQQVSFVMPLLQQFGNLQQGLLTQHELEKAATYVEVARQVVHDLRSPVATLNHLAKSQEPFDADMRQLLIMATQRVSDIADDLLVKTRSKPQVTSSMQNAVQSVVAEKRIEHSARATIEYSSNDVEDVEINVAPSGLQRVVSNLLNNAVEALDQGGTINVAILTEGDYHVLCVQDDGNGIPAEILKRLGKRGATFGKAGGNGLGLSSARELAEGAGGKMEILSTVDVGTEVKLYFPRAMRRAG